MKNKKLAKLSAVLIAALMVVVVLLATACTDHLDGLVIIRPDDSTSGAWNMLFGTDTTAQMRVGTDPENARGHAFEWSSSAPSVATVSDTGLVTALAIGTTTITLRAPDNDPIRQATVVVNVNTPVTGINVQQVAGATPHVFFTDETATQTVNFTTNTAERLTQRVGRYYYFTSILTPTGAPPAGAGNTEHRDWRSSDTAVANVVVGGEVNPAAGAVTGLGNVRVEFVGVGEVDIIVATRVSNQTRTLRFNVIPAVAGAISTPSDWLAMNDNLEGDFHLEHDLDLSGFTWDPDHLIGNTGSGDAYAFRGNLDGRGYTLGTGYVSIGTGAAPIWNVALFRRAVGSTFENININASTWFSAGGMSAVLLSSGQDVTIRNVAITSSGLWGYAIVRMNDDNPAALAGTLVGDSVVENVFVNVNSVRPLFANLVNIVGSDVTFTNVFTTGNAFVGTGIHEGTANTTITDNRLWPGSWAWDQLPEDIRPGGATRPVHPDPVEGGAFGGWPGGYAWGVGAAFGEFVENHRDLALELFSGRDAEGEPTLTRVVAGGFVPARHFLSGTPASMTNVYGFYTVDAADYATQMNALVTSTASHSVVRWTIGANGLPQLGRVSA